MDAIQKLSEKIKQATDLISKLKMEKQGLMSELDLLKNDLHEQSIIKQENQQLKLTAEKLRTRLEKISGRIDKLLSQEEPILNEHQGAHHE